MSRGLVKDKRSGEGTAADKFDFKNRYRGVQMPEYHELSAQLDDCISQLSRYHEIISSEQALQLRTLVMEVDGIVEFDIDEVSKQYQIFLRLQGKLLDADGGALANADVRDISSMLSSMTSLISLFLKANKEIDSIKEEAKLKAAVLRAVGELDEEARARFFEVLEEKS